MTEPSNDLKQKLHDAFRQAVRNFGVSWSPAIHGPELIIDGRPYTIEAVCGLVIDCGLSYPLPAATYAELCGHFDAGHQDLAVRLAKDPSYENAAKCLVKLVANKKAEYRHREASRGNS